jgi:hypothetical protein
MPPTRAQITSGPSFDPLVGFGQMRTLVRQF